MDRTKTVQEIPMGSDSQRVFRCGTPMPLQGREELQAADASEGNEKNMEIRPVKREQRLQITRRSGLYGPFDVLDTPQDMNAYLSMQVGKHVTAHFVAGSNNVFEVDGILQKVGRNYLVIKDIQNGDRITCDFYSVRFVRIDGNT